MFKEIADTYKKTGFLHHAYLVNESLTNDLLSFIEKDLLVPTSSNPDFLQISTETFGINDSRMLKENSSRKAIGEKQITVITFRSMTHEAQNALLKLFEEPTPNTHFFLVTKTPETILPTLFSRLFVISQKTRKTSCIQGDKFLRMKGPARLRYLQPIIEAKNKDEALTFLDEFELSLRHELLKKPSKERLHLLRELAVCKGYLFDRGSLMKMILEHIALTA